MLALPDGTQATGSGSCPRGGRSVLKPRAVYVAKMEFLVLACECGKKLARTPEGAYLCGASGCRWEGREMLAVTIPVAAMYEKRPA